MNVDNTRRLPIGVDRRASAAASFSGAAAYRPWLASTGFIWQSIGVHLA
jgi:hypothetical protein